MVLPTSLVLKLEVNTLKQLVEEEKQSVSKERKNDLVKYLIIFSFIIFINLFLLHLGFLVNFRFFVLKFKDLCSFFLEIS